MYLAAKRRVIEVSLRRIAELEKGTYKEKMKYKSAEKKIYVLKRRLAYIEHDLRHNNNLNTNRKRNIRNALNNNNRNNSSNNKYLKAIREYKSAIQENKSTMFKILKKMKQYKNQIRNYREDISDAKEDLEDLVSRLKNSGKVNYARQIHKYIRRISDEEYN